MKIRSLGSTFATLLALGAASFGHPLGTTGASAQLALDDDLPPVHDERLFNRAEREIHEALLATSEERRDAHIEAAEQVARHLVAEHEGSADAHYWLAVALGLKTEYGGPLEKLTTGKEVFFTTARVLELDPDHAGGHEMMGRLHAAVMRLPWLIRKMALGMGMGDALGEASWARAEEHFRRAAEIDPGAVAPRVELAKLYLSEDRPSEARTILVGTLAIRPTDEIDRRLLDEARMLHGSLTTDTGPQ